MISSRVSDARQPSLSSFRPVVNPGDNAARDRGLQKLNLLRATVGGLDGETAYTLSPAGRTLLQVRHARPRIA